MDSLLFPHRVYKIYSQLDIEIIEEKDIEVSNGSISSNLFFRIQVCNLRTLFLYIAITNSSIGGLTVKFAVFNSLTFRHSLTSKYVPSFLSLLRC